MKSHHPVNSDVGFQKTPPCSSYSTEALYAIGRNVVNFQRLEHNLKRLALIAPVSAPVSELKNVIETQRSKNECITLGCAVKNWLESINHATNQLPAPHSTNLLKNKQFEINDSSVQLRQKKAG